MMMCCVEGCNNALSPDNPLLGLAHSISFHLFPRKTVMKQKWLRAIGRPDWNPPVTALVCNRHFSSEQMDVSDPSEHKVKEDGFPDCALPVKSLDASPVAPRENSHRRMSRGQAVMSCDSSKSEQLSKLKVCRFCLATNVKMFSLEIDVLRSCIVGLNENYNMDGLPQYLCYICRAYLFKMYKVIEKSMIAQATLMEIYSDRPEVTESNIFESHQEKLQLVHTLQRHNETPCKVYEYVYDENLNTSILTSVNLESDRKENEKGSEDMIDSEVDFTARELSKLYMMLTQDIKESEDLLTDTYQPIYIDNHKPKTRDNSKGTFNSKCNKNTKAKIKDKSEKLLVQEHNGIQISLTKLDNNIKDTRKKRLVQEQNIVRKCSNETVDKIKNMNKKIQGQNIVRKRSNVSDNKTKGTNKKLQVQENNIVQTDSNVSDKSKNGIFAYEKDHDYLRTYAVDKYGVKNENNHDYLRAYAVDKYGVKTDIIIRNTVPPVPENKNEKSVRSTIPNGNLNVTGVKTVCRDETIASIKPRNYVVGSSDTSSCVTAVMTDHVHDDYFHTVILPLKEQKEQWSRAMEQRADPAGMQRCGVCSKWIRHGKCYDNHVARHHPIYGAYECEVCKIRFVSYDLRQRHIEATHLRKFVCKLCSKACYTMGGARQHALQHARRVHRCSLCARACRTDGELLRHVASHHHTALLPITSSASKPAPSGTKPGVAKSRRSPMILTPSEKRIAYNMYKHFEKNSVTYPVKTHLYKLTAQIVGFSFSSVTRLKKVISSIEKAQETRPEVPTSESQPFPCRSPTRSTSQGFQIKGIPTVRERRIMYNLYKHLEKASVTYPVKEDLYETTSQIMGCSPAIVRRTIQKFEGKILKNRSVVCPACGQRFPSQRAQFAHQTSCPGTLSKRESSEWDTSGRADAAGSARRSTRLKRKQKSKSRCTPEEMPPIEVAYECPICDEVFKTATMLNQHLSSVHQQLTKFGDSRKEYSGDGVDIRSGIDMKGRRVRDDSETDTCSEGEQYDDHGMAGRSLKGFLPPECYFEEEYYPSETLNMDAFDEDILL